jgi:thiol:disulfide interchange protein DsbD
MNPGILIFSVFITSIAAQVFAQNKVRWEAHYDARTSEIVISAKIEPGWHLYSTENRADLGPVPTYFTFPKQRNLKLLGKIKEQEPIIAFDANFGASLGYHENYAEFRQKVRLRKIKTIDFTVTYMVCDNSQCLPPIEVKLTVNIAS